MSLFFSTIGLGKQIVETKFVFQSNSPFSYLLCHFWLEYSICVLTRQRCSCARIFSSHIFFVFYSPNCSNSFLVFLWISRKINPLNAKTFSYFRGWACIFRFTGLSVVETVKKLEKSECWIVNGHGGMKVLKARNEGQDQNFRINTARKIGFTQIYSV